jgi:hypothetical protein
MALNRGAQADARGATQVLDRGGQAAARGSCLSELIERGAEAAARGAVACASQVLDRGAEAVACGAALPASCAQRQGNTRGDVPSVRWGRRTFLRSHLRDRGAKAGAQTFSCCHAALSQ